MKFQLQRLIISSSLVLVLLTACASPKMQSPERTAIPPNLATPCQNLPSLDDGTAASVLRWIAQAAELYAECKSRHGALVEAWR